MFGMNVLAFCVLLCATGCSAQNAARSTKKNLQPWLIGVSAVVGFLVLVFILVIGKKLLNIRRETEEKRGYEKTLNLDLNVYETNL